MRDDLEKKRPDQIDPPESDLDTDDDEPDDGGTGGTGETDDGSDDDIAP